MKKLFVLTTMCIVTMLFTNSAMSQVVASGITGACTWELTGTSGNYTLTISGSGPMWNYGDGTFSWHSYRTGIKTLDLQQGVTTIGNWAFYECSGLTSVTIPNSVTSIGEAAFAGCSGLTSVTIPNSVTSIGEQAFSGCSGLTSVTISNSVTYIENLAFAGCSGLTSVTIPNSVTIIGDAAFAGCSGLTSVTIPNSVTTIVSSAFSYCSGLTSVTIPNSVTSIGGQAFYNCSSLTTVNFNATNCTSMGDGSPTEGNHFWNCSSFTTLNIGNNVEAIPANAFYDCSGLTSITSYAVAPPAINSTTFQGVPVATPVYIPCMTRNAYQNSLWGNYFHNFIPPSDQATATYYNASICYGSSYSDNNFTGLSAQGSYSVDLANAAGCDSIVTLVLDVDMPPQKHNVCMISVDENNHNEVVWKKEEEVVTYRIYREGNQTGNYELAATVGYNSPSRWIDSVSNARIRSYRYKVAAVDSCGNESVLSDAHKTMHLTINQGQNNTWNLIWTAYEGVTYQTVNIYRATGNQPNDMVLIGTMTSTNTSYSDFSAPEGYVYYMVEIMLDDPCIISKSTTSIRSNVATNNPQSGIAKIETGNDISVYPNPTSSQLQIKNYQLQEGDKVELYNMLGHPQSLIVNAPLSILNVSHLANGVYMLRIVSGDKVICVRKVVIMR